MEHGWNPWHGCKKISEGCRNCYVYRMDGRYGRDSSQAVKTKEFDLPIRKRRDGTYRIEPGTLVYTCFTSDFFLPEADEWRKEAWQIIRQRSDLSFLIITKRIDRFYVSLPEDWGEGYPNVILCCTVENQDRADFRLPVFLRLPIVHKEIICEPLLGQVDLLPYLDNTIERVVAGGESGEAARPCRYEWIESLRKQCEFCRVSFHFKQTGAKFYKDGRLYRIKRKYQHSQAAKAGLDYRPLEEPPHRKMPEEKIQITWGQIK